METKISFNLSRLLTHVKDRRFGVLSAFLAGKDKKENTASHKELKEKVRSKGYGYKELKGFWTGESGKLEEEYSLFVPNITFEDIKDLGKTYNQEAVIYGNGDEIILFGIKEDHIVKQYHGMETNDLNKAWESYSNLRNKSFRFSNVDWYLAEPHTKDSYMGSLLNEAWFDLNSQIDFETDIDTKITLSKKAHLKLNK